MSITTEITQNIYDDDNSSFITVGPDIDSLGSLVRISVPSSSQQDFGKCDITISFEFAKALAASIIKATEVLPKY